VVFTKKCSGEVVGIFNIKNDKKMAKENSKQRLANLIQCYEQTVKAAQSLYDDDDLKAWAIDHSLLCQEKIKDVKKKLKDTFSIDYDATDAKKKVIKEGSEVEVLVNHMDGMKGGTATIKSYSLPANISDITMKDGMKMKDHKWLTNDEVKIK
jgi:predicted RNA-binding protein with EMAP domain